MKMRWVMKNGYNVLELHTEAVARLAEILKTKENVLRSRYLRYCDKRDGGEATEKDLDRLQDAEDDLELVQNFLAKAKGLSKS